MNTCRIYSSSEPDSFLEFKNFSNDPYSGEYSVSLSNSFFNLHDKKIDYCNCDFLEYPSSFFEALAKNNLPWDGTIEWRSLEYDLNLTATCSPLGHVTIIIKIDERDNDNTKYDRYVEDEISLGLGSLQEISKKVRTFFNVEEHEKLLEKFN